MMEVKPNTNICQLHLISEKKKLFVSPKHAREKLFNGKIKQKNFDGKTDYSL